MTSDLLTKCPYCDFAPSGRPHLVGGTIAVHLRYMHGEESQVEDYMRQGLDQMHNLKPKDPDDVD